jgi:hypothetical protein
MLQFKKQRSVASCPIKLDRASNPVQHIIKAEFSGGYESNGLLSLLIY